MKRSSLLSFLLVFLIFNSNAPAQKKRVPKAATPVQKSAANTNAAIVVNERLAVLRAGPSLYARPIQRMRVGRTIQISGSKRADGVTFYRVTALPKIFGWVQSDAVVAKTKRGDDERLAKLVQAANGFGQIECAMLFLETFAGSALRPGILLLLGDLIEDSALKLSAEATRRLNRREMAASGAPVHSFYLNYVSLDRYRKLGVDFLFNSSTKLFHYDGAGWKEIVAKFPKSSEAAEAQRRLDELKVKMEAKEK
ncbi:MAG TPA: SH3 domain-containing protein [Pyrinomonadaceae bacterium]|jgi:hypothetical protein